MVKKNSSVKRAIAAGVTAGILLISSAGCNNVAKNSNKGFITNKIASCKFVTNQYGSVDGKVKLDAVEESVLSDHNFVFLSMKNDGVPFDDIEQAKKDGKDIGLIVTPNDETYSSMYKTVDAVKGLIKEYDINCPILYDISKYMSDDSIKANCKLAEEFCNKLSANGCYVGLYGKKDDMKTFSDKFVETVHTHSIDLYDKMVVLDSEIEDEISDKDLTMGNMFEFANGAVLWKYELSKIIENRGLNEEKNFTEDYVYTVNDGDDISTISDTYDISAKDLMEYNDMKSDMIYPGDQIVVPNNYTDSSGLVVEEDTSYVEATPDSVEEQPVVSNDSGQIGRIVTGIDVSAWQGDIDWEKVKPQIDYAILRLCDFSCVDENGNVQIDSKFLQNMEACERLNIPVGVYYFSRATNSEEARKEAEFVADQLMDYTLEYPVYLDAETEELESMMFYQPEQFEDLAAASLGYLQSRGYYTGIYTGVTDSVNIMHMSDNQSFWLTSHETYDNEVNVANFDGSNYNLVYTPDSKVNAYQYCQKGSIDGIEGEIDVDYATIELSRTIEQGGYNKPKSR